MGAPGQAEEDDRAAWEREEREERIAEEKRELDSAWQEQVTSVLSHTRLDPQTTGQQFEWFEKYEADVTPEQVAALRKSNYGTCFQEFIDLWTKLPETGRPDLSQAAEVFRLISVITHGAYNELCHQDKNAKRTFTQIETLKGAHWLESYFWNEGISEFDSHELGEQLNGYIGLGMEWSYLERSVLKRCIRRAADEQRKKVKLPIENPLIYLPLRLVGFLVPNLIWLAVEAAILVWSLHHLQDHLSVWAIVGLVFVGFTLPVGIIHHGTAEIRRLLKRSIDPTWDPYEPRIHAELRSLDHTVNSFRDHHINLRLVREQITRLQSTEIHIPVQLLTLIDRSIAKGVHAW